VDVPDEVEEEVEVLEETAEELACAETDVVAEAVLLDDENDEGLANELILGVTLELIVALVEGLELDEPLELIEANGLIVALKDELELAVTLIEDVELIDAEVVALIDAEVVALIDSEVVALIDAEVVALIDALEEDKDDGVGVL